MEYLEYLKALSSGDSLQQISSIPRIVCLIKEQPSAILVNTIAITMSVEFTQSSNRVRYFIADFFSQCSTEMCMIRSKQEVLQHLMSVLDINDPIAQCLMLKILGSLAPLLTDMIEVHHKLLLTLEGTHRQVRETAYSILPRLISYCPTIAKHVFDKNIPQHFILNICKVLPDEEETVKRAYSYIVRNFSEDSAIEILFALAYRCRSIVNHVKYILIKHQELGKLLKLCSRYGRDNILTENEKKIVLDLESRPQEIINSSISEILSQPKLEGNLYSEKHYRYIYQNWGSADKYVWVTNRLNNPEEVSFCYKLLYLLKVPSTYLADVKKFSLDLALCLIRGGWRGSNYEIIYSLNSWEQYQCACELMKKGESTHAHQIFLKIRKNFRGNNEKAYEWICALIEVTNFESKKTGGIKALSHLGCLGLGSSTYFQSEFFLCRYLVITALVEGGSGKNITETLFALRNRLDKLLYLFAKPCKDTVYIIKRWRELLGMLALCLTCLEEECDFAQEIEKFYPISGELISECYSLKSPQAFCRYALEIKMEYPKQFFVFMKPIGLDLSIQSDMHVKLARGAECNFELAAKIKEISHKTPNLKFIFTCVGNNKEEFRLEREKHVSSAGVCNMTVPIVLNSYGLFYLKVYSTILSNEGREIGKPEYAEILLECI